MLRGTKCCLLLPPGPACRSCGFDACMRHFSQADCSCVNVGPQPHLDVPWGVHVGRHRPLPHDRHMQRAVEVRAQCMCNVCHPPAICAIHGIVHWSRRSSSELSSCRCWESIQWRSKKTCKRQASKTTLPLSSETAHPADIRRQHSSPCVRMRTTALRWSGPGMKYMLLIKIWNVVCAVLRPVLIR